MIPKIDIIKGDITAVPADALVNAANSSLMGGGGVDGAIHRVGGPAILEACREIVARQGGCRPGEAVITTAGELPARFVIHTVGPIWQGGEQNERKILASCYINSLKLAIAHQCRSIAFPNISTGVYRFPKDEAALIAVSAVTSYLHEQGGVAEVVFVCFDEENYQLMKAACAKYQHN